MKRQTGHAAEHEPERWSDVVVQRRQRARREACVELQDRGEHHPREEARGGIDRRLGTTPRQEPRELTGGEQGNEEQRDDEDGEREGVRGDLRAEPALVAGPSERR